MPIDRKALVARHRIRLTRPDAKSPLSVGNGEFAFTADITGLQTFPEFHLSGMPLGTQAQWGWHTMPNPQGYRLDDALTTYETPRGLVPYPDQFTFPGEPSLSGQEAGKWLHANPQRLDLGRIGLEMWHGGDDAAQVEITDLTQTQQTLDLWQGLLENEFQLDDQPVQVQTVCHPHEDLLAVHIESPLLATGRLAVQFAFPYASDSWNSAADWSQPERHVTQHQISNSQCRFKRLLDDDRYYATLSWSRAADLLSTGPHQYRLRANGISSMEFVIAFAPTRIDGPLPTYAQTRAACARYWEDFWTQGGAVDLSASSDSRAQELERRVVLSQYQTAINCAGSLPPQETGLVCNSWGGKFHLEMHWWHAAHFALWGRGHLLERGLPWYQRILPVAQATARRQGYQGARWPKQVGPEGRESPSPIGAFLIWQQPHPIYYAELLWRVRREQAIVERYRQIVFETAAFMASFPVFDGERYILGPPLVPAQESYWKERTTVINPTFELAYWYWGLETAQRWRERLGLPRDPDWERVKNGLARPMVRNGVYTAIQTAPYTIRDDHPSMLGALGFVPQTPLIDADVMHQTLGDVQAGWDWPSTWGWDYPLLAMCAARLGKPADAVDALLMEMPKNTYLANGHNQQWPSFLPLYLPGNGGLLMAIAMMVAGWDGDLDRHAPGFPPDGTWVVQAEGILPMP